LNYLKKINIHNEKTEKGVRLQKRHEIQQRAGGKEQGAEKRGFAEA